MGKVILAGMIMLFCFFLSGCSGSDSGNQPAQTGVPPRLFGGILVNVPLYKDGGVDALKNWPPPADPGMGDANTSRDVVVKGADNVSAPDGTLLNNDTWSPKCPTLEAPASWPHPGNERIITIKNSCSFPVWIGLQSGVTELPPFCSASKASCADGSDCPAVPQTCSGGVCSEDTKSCDDDTDCAAVTQTCVNNAHGDGFRVASGASRTYALPNNWTSGALWGRTNCRDCTADHSVGTRCCDTGDAGGTLYNRHEDGSALGPEKPITKVELNLISDPDYYDVSQVDGFNLPVQMTPVPGTGDDTRKTTGYWLGCPGVTGNVNGVCPDATMIQDTSKYPFGSDFPLGIALKNASGNTIACLNGCSYKTRGACGTDGLPCRKDQDCALIKVCSGDNTQSCTKDDDCTSPQTCDSHGQSCIPPPGNPNLLPQAADYCCDGSEYCGTVDPDSVCNGKKRCPVTAISAFYKAMAPSAYATPLGEDSWSTFNAGWKSGVGPDYYIEFCP